MISYWGHGAMGGQASMRGFSAAPIERKMEIAEIN
jgi:hypothetical protein